MIYIHACINTYINKSVAPLCEYKCMHSYNPYTHFLYLEFIELILLKNELTNTYIIEKSFVSCLSKKGILTPVQSKPLVVIFI